MEREIREFKLLCEVWMGQMERQRWSKEQGLQVSLMLMR